MLQNISWKADNCSDIQGFQFLSSVRNLKLNYLLTKHSHYNAS